MQGNIAARIGGFHANIGRLSIFGYDNFLNHVITVAAGNPFHLAAAVAIITRNANVSAYNAAPVLNGNLLAILPNFALAIQGNHSAGLQYAVFNQKWRPVQMAYANVGIADDDGEPLLTGIIRPTLKNYDGANMNIPLVRNLSFMGSDGKQVTVINNTAGVANANHMARHRLGLEGYFRYSTRLVRWIEWFAQIQRVVRILMRQQLEWVQDPVVREHNALAEGVTEFNPDNRGYMLSDFD